MRYSYRIGAQGLRPTDAGMLTAQ